MRYGARKTLIEWICVSKQKRHSWVLTNCIRSNKTILKQKKKAADIFYSLYSFTFSRMSYNWHHAVYNLFQTSLFYLITLIQVSSISFCDLMVHFFLFLNNILLCWCTVVCLSSCLLKGTWVASNFCVCVCVCVRVCVCCVWKRER